MAIIGTVREIWRYPVKSMAGERLERCTVGDRGIPGDRGWALRDDAAGEIRGARRFPVLVQCGARYRSEPSEGNVPHVDITLPDGSRVGSDDPAVSATLARLIGRPATLWPIQPASHAAHYRRAQPGAAFAGKIAKTRTARRLLQGVLRVTGLDAPMREEMSREPGEPLPDLSDAPAELIEFATLPGTYFDAFPIHFLTTASLAAMARLNPVARWDPRRFRPNFVIETAAGSDGLVEHDWNGRTLAIGALRLRCDIPTVRCGIPTHPQGDLPKDPSILRSIVADAGQSLGSYARVERSGTIAAGDPIELL